MNLVSCPVWSSRLEGKPNHSRGPLAGWIWERGGASELSGAARWPKSVRTRKFSHRRPSDLLNGGIHNEDHGSARLVPLSLFFLPVLLDGDSLLLKSLLVTVY